MVGLVHGHGLGSGPVRVFARRANDRHMGIVIGDDGPALLQLLKQPIARRFALVVDIRLVGQTKNEDPTSFNGLCRSR